MKRTHVFFIAALIVAAGVGFAGGFWMPDDDDFFEIRKNFEIFGSAYEELVTTYVDPLDAQKMMRTGLEAMLDDLDPYTVFFDEADNVDMDLLMRGSYGGVGLNVEFRNEQLTVSAPDKDASGYKQGIRAGDIITHIGDTPTAGLSLLDVHNLMRGEPGTVVEFIIEREGEPEPLRFMLTREDVEVRSVKYAGFVDHDTASALAYVKLERFGQGAGQEVRRALQEMHQAQPLRGIVLDLRDNPGGLLEAAVEITQLFVPQDAIIVSTRGRTPQTERVYRSKTPPLFPDVPVVVQMNEFSASASEIVAGALQDLDRGLIVGTPSFGKGLVQVVRPLPYNTSIKITTSKYYTPSGRSIQAIDYSRHDGTFEEVPDSLLQSYKTARGRTVRSGNGIEPDVEATLGEESELEEALRRRAAFFFFANYYAAEHKREPQTPEERFYNPDGEPIALNMNAILDEFQTWLAAQDFAYETAAERAVDELAGELEANGYTDTDDEVTTLQRAIDQEKQNDFERHAPRLKELLRAEILARFVTPTQQIEATLTHDPQFQQAVALLNDPRAYHKALGR